MSFNYSADTRHSLHLDDGRGSSSNVAAMMAVARNEALSAAATSSSSPGAGAALVSPPPLPPGSGRIGRSNQAEALDYDPLANLPTPYKKRLEETEGEAPVGRG